MSNTERQLVKIIKEICCEKNIPLHTFSYDWILQLNAPSKPIFIYGYQFQNNSATAQLITNDKSALSDILRENHIPTVEHIFFRTPENMSYLGKSGNWKPMLALLEKHGALVLKPNDGTGGNHVYKVTTLPELENAVFSILQSNLSLSVSPFYEIESEYRVIVLDHSVELIYKKEIPYLTGDGEKSLYNLCLEKYENTSLLFGLQKPLDFVLPFGETLSLEWKHNLGKGASAKIIEDEKIQRELSELALSAAKLLDIHFSSIDIIQTNGHFKILEINSGIMMESFSMQSEENYLTAKAIYEKALNALFV